MKLSLAAAMAGTLWAAAAHAQALPSSGPGSAIPLGPDDTPLITRAIDFPLIATGPAAGLPGPYLPNPSDPMRVLLGYPGFGFVPE
jgi:hypothetical protein